MKYCPAAGILCSLFFFHDPIHTRVLTRSMLERPLVLIYYFIGISNPGVYRVLNITDVMINITDVMILYRAE